MNNLPKSRISELKECFLQWRNDYDPVEDAPQYRMFSDAMAAMDMLLEGMEQEPVAKVDYVGVTWYTDKGVSCKPAIGSPLYAATVVSQPAPVAKSMMFIDGDISSEDADKLAKILQDFNAEEPLDNGEYGSAYQGSREDLAIWKRRALEAEEKLRTAPVAVPDEDLFHMAASAIEDLLDHQDPNTDYYSGVWADVPAKLRRAAMLNHSGDSAEKVNSPVIPDGWIKCSDRMPEEHEPVLVHQEGGVIFCAEYEEDYGFCPDEFPNVPKQGCEITHWMPLPNPPAPEA